MTTINGLPTHVVLVRAGALPRRAGSADLGPGDPVRGAARRTLAGALHARAELSETMICFSIAVLVGAVLLAFVDVRERQGGPEQLPGILATDELSLAPLACWPGERRDRVRGRCG